MGDDWIAVMQKEKRLKLDVSDTFTHYAIVVALLIVPCVILYDLSSLYIFHNYTGNDSAIEMCEEGLPWIILAIIACLIQIRALRFREFRIKQSVANFNEAVERTAKQLEWRIEKNNSHFARARRGWNWEGSWGEMITIIRTDDCFLINSICDPSQRPSFTSYVWNRKNVKKFFKI